MRISFDIDDTLVCAPSVPTEQFVSWWWRWRYPELLRAGTRSLMRELLSRRCQLWIYTTSYRPARYLRGWFARTGVPIYGVVNQHRHDRVVRGVRRRNAYPPSKYPPAFGIDLHVDDSEGVAIEGKQYGFRVVVVSPDDSEWAARVLAAVDGER